MKMLLLRKSLRRVFSVTSCLLLTLLIAQQQGVACSWDYNIWIIRSKTADPLYRFLKDGKAGYIDRTGKVVVKPELDYYGNHAGEFESGLLKVHIDHDKFVDATGKLVIEKEYASVWDFSDGLAAVLLENGGKWGYIDRTGEFAISPRFDGHPLGYPSSFSDGMAMIRVGDEHGYIDHTGEFVIQPKFIFGADFHEGFARVVLEGPCLYWSGEPCSMGMTRVPNNSEGPADLCKFMFIDKSGSILPGASYDGAKDFSEGFAAVQVKDKWGFIDSTGRMVIKPQFEAVESFSDGMALVREGELWGYIDTKGKLVIGYRFKWAEDFSEGLAVIGNWNEAESEYDDFYYINKRGIQVLPERFAQASGFFKGLAHVKLKTRKPVCPEDEMSEEGSFAYIDLSGRKIFKYQNCVPEEE